MRALHVNLLTFTKIYTGDNMKIKNILKSLLPPKIIKNGENNIIKISKSAYIRKVKISVYGNNNIIEIGDNTYLHKVNIKIGFGNCPINNCTIRIGEKTSFNSTDIQLGESGSSLIIGDDCMFSFDIEITCSDTHSVLDMEGNLINKGENITIGNHVWVGKEVKILKNTAIADNCIIAQNSIVTKKFDTRNAVIAGNPAKVVKENINWVKDRPQWILNSKREN